LTNDQINAMFSQEYKAAIQAIQAIFNSRTHVYNATESMMGYFPRGVADLLYEIEKKTRRLRNGMDAKENPNVESIIDNALDIANYALFIVAYLETEEAMNKEQKRKAASTVILSEEETNEFFTELNCLYNYMLSTQIQGAMRERLLKAFEKISERTGYEYEGDRD